MVVFVEALPTASALALILLFNITLCTAANDSADAEDDDAACISLATGFATATTDSGTAFVGVVSAILVAQSNTLSIALLSHVAFTSICDTESTTDTPDTVVDAVLDDDDAVALQLDSLAALAFTATALVVVGVFVGSSFASPQSARPLSTLAVGGVVVSV